MSKFYLKWNINNKCVNTRKHCYQNNFNETEVSINLVNDLFMIRFIIYYPKASINLFKKHNSK